MLTPEPRGVNITGALVIHGDSWQQRSSAGSIVADDATLIDGGRLSGLLKTLSKFIQWHSAHGDARWGL
jgi:fatty acid-binding protein DegV